MPVKTRRMASHSGESQLSEKRKSMDGTEDQPILEDGPATKKQKLPVRGKAPVYSSHKSVSIEIPLPRLSKRAKTAGEVEEVDDSQDEGDDVSGDEEIFKTPMEKKHIIFDDDDHEEFVTPLERPVSSGLDSSVAPLGQLGSVAEEVPDGEEKEEKDEEGEEDEGDEDSDDDAPEAVSTHQAAADSKKAVQAAAKAAEEQAAAKRRKRQERDAFFKKQAEERKQASAQAAQAEGLVFTEDGADLDRSGSEEPTSEMQRKRKLEVPDVLPLELLETDDEEETLPVALAAGRQPKKIRFDTTTEKRLPRGERHPRDQRVGSTVYRVIADKSDQKLAPKASKQTINRKQQMLVRKRDPKRRGGFFVKG